MGDRSARGWGGVLSFAFPTYVLRKTSSVQNASGASPVAWTMVFLQSVYLVCVMMWFFSLRFLSCQPLFLVDQIIALYPAQTH